jgi:glutathione S-transferase
LLARKPSTSETRAAVTRSDLTDTATVPSAPGTSQLRVYHRVGAGRPIRVVWALEELGSDYELTVLSAEEARAPAHLARHPMGRVPVIEDAEGSLFESTALCLHIGELDEKWAIFAMTELEAPAIEHYRLRESSPEGAARAAERCGMAASAIEAALTGSHSLLPAGFTVADIVVSEVVRVAERVGAIKPTPATQSYVDAMAQRPARVRAAARLA